MSTARPSKLTFQHLVYDLTSQCVYCGGGIRKDFFSHHSCSKDLFTAAQALHKELPLHVLQYVHVSQHLGKAVISKSVSKLEKYIQLDQL